MDGAYPSAAGHKSYLIALKSQIVMDLLTSNTTETRLKSQQEHKLSGDRYHIQPDSKHSGEKSTVLNHANSFALMDCWGDIYPAASGSDGIYHRGTRFINEWVLTIDGKKPLLLGSTIKQHNNIHSVDLTNPVLAAGKIPENTLHIFRHQLMLDAGYYERITCVNYNESDISCSLSLYFDGDFKDIFEIRGTKRQLEPGSVEKICQDSRSVIRIEYMGQDHIKRTAVIKYEGSLLADCQAQKMVFALHLQPHEQQQFQIAVHFMIGSAPNASLCFDQAKKQILEERSIRDHEQAQISSDNINLNNWLHRAYTDLFSLYAEVGQNRYIYAGVPWYNTPFGRDGLITAIELLWIQPQMAKNVLLFLAHWQAHAFSSQNDAEPGKILHEAREGEMANTGEIPFKRYYGTVDATPLFILLAGKYYKRTGDLAAIKAIWPAVLDGLAWMDVSGDIDQDHFVEYQFKNPDALTNQGWKDSVDAIMHKDGTLAKSPIALCEVQGYAYEAKLLAADMAAALEHPQLAEKLSNSAVEIRRKFNDIFWDGRLKCFVLALDGEKEPCRVCASNAGHALFTGIADKEKSAQTMQTLMSAKMFSLWGIRTLASDSVKFNPMSYHNGSIWPHDNALIAMGFARYGFKSAVVQIFNGLFEATTFIDLNRLPELFCGLKKRNGEGPTAYPVACAPQAWAVGSVFLLLASLLGIEIDAPKKQIVFHDPVLPEKVQVLHIDQLLISNNSCQLTVTTGSFGPQITFEDLPEDWSYKVNRDELFW